jgi:hypothetical protein
MKRIVLAFVSTVLSTLAVADTNHCKVKITHDNGPVVANLCYDFSDQSFDQRKILAKAYCSKADWPQTTTEVDSKVAFCPITQYGKCTNYQKENDLGYTVYYYETGLGTTPSDYKETCEGGGGKWLSN